MEREYERLYARILVTFENGSEICYAYNRESLMTLGLEPTQYDKSCFIEVDTFLTINGKKYLVKKVNFMLHPKLYDMSGDYGINVYGITEPTDFNCQIGVFVEEVNS